MYNIHSHYENIFSYVKTLLAEPRVVYLHPFGSTQIENLESIKIGSRGPLLFCFDQEPIIPDYNRNLFSHVRNYTDESGRLRPTIVLTTEKNSKLKNNFLKEFNFIDCYYFFHAFAAADWYRGYQYCADLTSVRQRKIKKKYITFNRITGGARVYRSALIAELVRANILHQGYVSYSEVCPEYGPYQKFLTNLNSSADFNNAYLKDILSIMDTIQFPLRIDNKDLEYIPNNSQTLSAIPECMESFLHLVTETCFFDNKLHLTEKIFKPIVCKQPFLLLGCAHNLKYLQSYGFKTFDRWWDESYDQIEDPQNRLQTVVKLLDNICKLSNNELEKILVEMEETLEYNYNWFYSKEFLDLVWNELTTNLTTAISQAQLQISQGILNQNRRDSFRRISHG